MDFSIPKNNVFSICQMKRPNKSLPIFLEVHLEPCQTFLQNDLYRMYVNEHFQTMWQLPPVLSGLDCSGAQPGIFYGRVVFLELGHFDEHSPTTRARNALQGKNLQFFGLETLEYFILNNKFHLQMSRISTFFSKLGHYFPIFEKGQRRPLPSPLPPVALRTNYIFKNSIIQP